MRFSRRQKRQAMQELMAEVGVVVDQSDDADAHAYVLTVYDPETEKTYYVGPLKKDRLSDVMVCAQALQDDLNNPLYNDSDPLKVTVERLMPPSPRFADLVGYG